MTFFSLLVLKDFRVNQKVMSFVGILKDFNVNLREIVQFQKDSEVN